MLYSFCCPVKWISYMYTHTPSLWTSLHPKFSRSSQNNELSSLFHLCRHHIPPHLCFFLKVSLLSSLVPYPLGFLSLLWYPQCCGDPVLWYPQCCGILSAVVSPVLCGTKGYSEYICRNWMDSNIFLRAGKNEDLNFTFYPSKGDMGRLNYYQVLVSIFSK